MAPAKSFKFHGAWKSEEKQEDTEEDVEEREQAMKVLRTVATVVRDTMQQGAAFTENSLSSYLEKRMLC